MPLTNGQLIAELSAPELEAQRAEAVALLADLEAGARPEELAAAKKRLAGHRRRNWSWRAPMKSAPRPVRQRNHFRNGTRPRRHSRRHAFQKRGRRQKPLRAAARRHRTNRIEQARATLGRIETQLAELRVFAPTNCLLEVLSVKVGDVVPPNRELATLILSQQLWIRVYVAQPRLGELKIGDDVELRADAWPAKTFHGAIEQISRSAEFTPRNVQPTEERVKRVFGVKIRLNNDSGELRPGMTGDVIF
jgi:HlyD family secretion protein